MEFRESLRKPMPNAPKRTSPRVVPAFTIQTLQKNTIVQPPPKAGAYLKRPPKLPTRFRRFYIRGDLPISMGFDAGGNKVAWKVGFLYNVLLLASGKRSVFGFNLKRINIRTFTRENEI